MIDINYKKFEAYSSEVILFKKIAISAQSYYEDKRTEFCKKYLLDADFEDEAKSDKVKVDVTVVGERPCASDLNQAEFDNLIHKCQDIIKNIRIDI